MSGKVGLSLKGVSAIRKLVPERLMWPFIFFIPSQFCILSIIISFFGMSVRFYTVGITPAGTSGRNRSKQIADKLNTRGMYSITRNPLYFGNYLIWLGISIYSLNIFFTII